jgi:hypothetical protein
MQGNSESRSARIIATAIFVCSTAISLLSGCGVSATNAVAPKPAISPLNGNWWITGDLPGLPSLNLANEKFGIAATFDVVNGTVYTSLSDFYPCTSGGAGGSGRLEPASLNPDGSFVLQTINGATPSTIQLTIKGTSPAAAGETWSGSFSGTNANNGCLPIAGTFTATPIAPFTGSFVGTGLMGPQSPGLLSPQDPSSLKQMTFALNLTQGGPSTLDTMLSVDIVNSVNSLSATITVTGSPCFGSGTTGTTLSSVNGNNFGLMFTMDDGSALLLNGYASEPTLSSVTITHASVKGGNCDGWLGLIQTALTKQ